MAKLHYRITTLLLFGSCVLVTALDWIGNGNKITCVMEGNSDDWSIPPAVINTYCYIMSTFTLPSQLAGDVGKNVAYQGVGTYNSKTEEVTIKAYYQWVPFILFFQACLFYIPHMLCKAWEGGKISGIISGLNSMVIDRTERSSKQKVLAQYLVDNLNTHNIWAVKIFLTEIIYFLNVLANIYLIDVFLGKTEGPKVEVTKIGLHYRWRVQKIRTTSGLHDGGGPRGQGRPDVEDIPADDQVHLQQVRTRRNSPET